MPTAPAPVQLRNITRGFAEFKRKKYTQGSLVSLSPNDIVVDVGAFIGPFTLGAAPEVSEVISVEPSPQTAAVLRENVAHLDNVSVREFAAWSSSTTLMFKLGEDASDNSAIDVDKSGVVSTMEVRAERLDETLDGPVDFLKIDAEGAEPEAVEGAGTIARQVAVDVSPERHGESTEDEVRSILESRGYECERSGAILSGTLE